MGRYYNRLAEEKETIKKIYYEKCVVVINNNKK